MTNNDVAVFLLSAYAEDLMRMAKHATEYSELKDYGAEMGVIEPILEYAEGQDPSEEFAGDQKDALIAHLAQSYYGSEEWWYHQLNAVLVGKALPRDFREMSGRHQQEHGAWFQKMYERPPPQLQTGEE